MKFNRALYGAAAMFAVACSPVSPTEEGGSNAHDRSAGGDEGEVLEAGAMAIAPSGRYIVAQRNTTTLIVDVEGRSYRELDFQGERFAFSKTREVVYVVLKDLGGVVALDLATGGELWRTMPAFASSVGALLARVTSDDAALLVGDFDRVFLMDPQTGDVRDVVKVGAVPQDLALTPDEKRAIVVGRTSWSEAGPRTPVSLVDLAKRTAATIEVPNCAAPVSILPDGARVLLSPTFCAPDQASAPKAGWKNPDPVSVIDVDASAGTLSFLKNLPGFGPTSLLADGRAVAYLDMKRLDPAMFDDPSQIPAADGPQYHLMLIDPKTTRFSLHPIGARLPRFAPSKDGRSLLVDATVSVVRSEITATVTLDASGLRAEVKGAFGDASGSLFGVFDLGTKQYVPFSGPAAALDRFVQIDGGSQVFTLKDNGRGGDLFAIDVGARATADLGRSLRDIGLMPDGRTLVLRVRLSPTADGYLRETFCFSRDGRTCDASVDYKSPVPQHDP